MATLMHYQIMIQGHLDSTWSEWFDGLAITTMVDGTTTLEGDLVDQAALYGVLNKICDLSLPLLAVSRVAEKEIRIDHDTARTTPANS